MKYRVERTITVLMEVEADSEDEAIELTPLRPVELPRVTVKSVGLQSLKVWEDDAHRAP